MKCRCGDRERMNLVLTIDLGCPCTLSEEFSRPWNVGSGAQEKGPGWGGSLGIMGKDAVTWERTIQQPGVPLGKGWQGKNCL